MADESVEKEDAEEVSEVAALDVGSGKRGKVSPGEAEVTAILDSIFTKGFYEEEIPLIKNHGCVLRTRTSDQAIDISARLERDDSGKMSRIRYNQLYSLYCLTTSLVSFDNEALPEKLEEKVRLVGSWAGPLVDFLLVKLSEFDDKVAAAYTAEQTKN